jgi:hypothetical protein
MPVKYEQHALHALHANDVVDIPRTGLLHLLAHTEPHGSNTLWSLLSSRQGTHVDSSGATTWWGCSCKWFVNALRDASALCWVRGEMTIMGSRDVTEPLPTGEPGPGSSKSPRARSTVFFIGTPSIHRVTSSSVTSIGRLSGPQFPSRTWAAPSTILGSVVRGRPPKISGRWWTMVEARCW